MRHFALAAMCALLVGCFGRPGHFDDDDGTESGSTGYDESESGEGDGDGDGDGDYPDFGDEPKFDVLFVPDAPEEEPELPQCTVVPKCSPELNEQAKCSEGMHCVADPDPGHCESDQDNSTCVCGHVQCEDGQLCTWSDDLSWYLCD